MKFTLATTLTLLAGTANLPLLQAQQEVEAVDFLVTSKYTDIADEEHHFVARIYDPDSIATARAELEKEDPPFMIISGIIEKEPAEWNLGWSYHFKPETVFFGDFFIEVCDATFPFTEENLEDAGGAFLPGLQLCPWGSRVLEELGNETVIVTDAPTETPSDGNSTEMPTEEEGDEWVDFLVLDRAVNQTFVARMTNPIVIDMARGELEKEDGYMIVGGTIAKEPAEWNPGWSFHMMPDSIELGDVFFEVCDANVEYVEENLADAGGAFLPNNFWCPWTSAIIEELGSSEDSESPSPDPTVGTTPEPTSSGTSLSFVAGAWLVFVSVVIGM